MSEKKHKKTFEIPVDGEDPSSSSGQAAEAGEEEKVDETGLKLRQAEEKAAEYLDRLQRLQAEFSNYRKRVDKEKEGLRDWLHGLMLVDILPVLDDLDRMVQSLESQNPIDLDGVKLIQQKLQKALKDRGLQEIESIGQKFNPELHEAVGVETTEPDKAGLVLEEWQKGYKIGDRLLRPSRVKVGKAEEKAGDDAQ